MATLPDTRLTGADVARGVCRMLHRGGDVGLCEVPLGNGRRADVMALSPDGCITIVEIKVSLADLRGDGKWTDYLAYCDRFYWAIGEGVALAHLDAECFLPERAGLIAADRYDAEIVRAAPTHPLSGARRKAETLRFARCAALRLVRANDPLVDAGC